jgi:hypothetical protein
MDVSENDMLKKMGYPIFFFLFIHGTGSDIQAKAEAVKLCVEGMIDVHAVMRFVFCFHILIELSSYFYCQQI